MPRAMVVTAAFFLAVVSASLPFADSASGQDQTTGYLSTVFSEGVPYEEARMAGQHLWTSYAKALQDPERSATWGNAVAAIGASGADGAQGVLSAFLQGLPSGRPLSPAACRAAFAVPVALAYHANVSPSSAALSLLDGFARGANRAQWSCQYHHDAAEAAREFQDQALRALGLSGRPEVPELLADVEATTTDRDLSVVLGEARQLHQLVSGLGLAEYYRQSREQFRNRRKH